MNVFYFWQYRVVIRSLVLTAVSSVTAEVEQDIVALMMADVQTENAAMAGLTLHIVKLVCTNSGLV